VLVDLFKFIFPAKVNNKKWDIEGILHFKLNDILEVLVNMKLIFTCQHHHGTCPWTFLLHIDIHPPCSSL